MAPKELQGLVDTIVAATAGLPSPATLAAWQPALSGDIDIRIGRDGTWWHEGSPILREGLVRLFASLLRREGDGEYYLVTPVEKWRIQVERHALQVVDVNQITDPKGVDKGESDNPRVWEVLLNTGGRCTLDASHRLHVPAGQNAERNDGGQEDESPFVNVPSGLTAQLSRPAWYRLVEAATVEDDIAFIESAGVRHELGSITV